jgi:hypothetical protein
MKDYARGPTELIEALERLQKAARNGFEPNGPPRGP